jgi:hypothetical protein
MKYQTASAVQMNAKIGALSLASRGQDLYSNKTYTRNKIIDTNFQEDQKMMEAQASIRPFSALWVYQLPNYTFRGSMARLN